MTEAIDKLVYAAAHKYSLEDLQKECVRFLFSWMTEITVKKLFEMATKYAIDDLKEECVRIPLSDIQVIWSNVHLVGEVKNAALEVAAKNGETACLSTDYEKMMRTRPVLCLKATLHMWP